MYKSVTTAVPTSRTCPRVNGASLDYDVKAAKVKAWGMRLQTTGTFVCGGVESASTRQTNGRGELTSRFVVRLLLGELNTSASNPTLATS